MDDYERSEKLEAFSNELADELIEKILARGKGIIPESILPQLWQAISLHRIAESLERQFALLQDEILPTLEVISGERRGRK